MARAPLPRSYVPRDVFKSALGFSKACDYINNLDHKNNPFEAAFMGHPMIAMSALAVELLLKTLHAIHSENPVPGLHDLGKLYRGLSEVDRVAIQKRWLSIHKEWHEKFDQVRRVSGVDWPTPRNVEVALDEGAKAFQQARYQFEPDSKHFTYYVDFLRQPLIDLVLERQPELGAWTLTTTHRSWDASARKEEKK